MSQSLPKSVKVAVIGAGAMGSGIAQVAARAGHVVYLHDSSSEATARGKAAIAKDLRFLVDKGRLADAEYAAVLERVVPAGRIDDFVDAGLVIEAIVEDLDVKRRLFVELEAKLAPDAILGSNTSSLSITAIAAALKRPGRVAGVHFFNPAPRMALVEIVSGLATDPQVAATLDATVTAWGKIAVQARSTPGFIVNRVARPYYSEALRVLGENAATPATLDAVMREACGFPMGPFELMDMIGLDVNYAVTRSVFDASFGDRRYAPSLIQQELVLAGRLGRKSGRGFYDYSAGSVRPAPATAAAEPAPASVSVVGDLGAAEALLARMAAAGVAIDREDGEGGGWIQIGSARLQMSDGRSATQRGVEEHCPHLVLFDLARDYATTPRLAIAAADTCPNEVLAPVTGALQAAGIAVSRIDDVPGLIALRSVVMLANEAADAVVQSIGKAADIDTAMRHGTNYPEGPLAWADRLGIATVARVIANLRRHYREDRYRSSPLLQRLGLVGGRFHSPPGEAGAPAIR